MNRNLFKSIVNLFLVFAVLALALLKFDLVLMMIHKFIVSVKPLLIATAIAFILRIFQKRIYFRLCQLMEMAASDTSEIEQIEQSDKSDNADDGSAAVDVEKCGVSGANTSKKKQNICKILSVILTYVLVFGIVIALFSIIIPQAINSLSKLTQNFDAYKENMDNMVKFIEEKSEFFNWDFNELKASINDLPNKIASAFGDIVLKLYNFTFDIIGMVTTLILAIILSVYMLSGTERISSFWSEFLNIYVKEPYRTRIWKVVSTSDEVFSQFVIGQLTEAFILGGLCFAGMIFFKFDYAPLISTMIGALSLIPLLGAFLGAGIACLLLFIISPMQAFWFVIFFVILQQLEGNLIYPKVVGSSIGLPPIMVLVSILVGGSLFGLIGTVLAVPVSATVYKLLKEDMNSRAKS